MSDNKTIKILVSCPGDVFPEKELVIRLCSAFSDANHGKSDIVFSVLDWKNYVGEYGIRPQQQLKEYFGVYDVYIGILWKRFGTNPGSVNSTGEENQSGTQEEFYDAVNYRSEYGRPSIHFFFKTNDRTANTLDEITQLEKVLKFIDDQQKQKNHYLNFFNSDAEFNSMIIKILKKIEHSSTFENLLEDKKGLRIEDIKIANFTTDSIKLPENYIVRSTSHFKLIKDKLTKPVLESEQQSLDELMLSTNRVVLLGDAGSGKSTELKYLFNRLNRETSPFVSILQNFNTYTPELGLEAFLPDLWKSVPNNLLMIIWDGLDEIEPRYFMTVVRQINAFSEKYREIRILISSRTNFYELPVNNSVGTLSGFEPYFINDLNVGDAKDYYSRQYSSIETDNFIKEVFDNNLGDLLTKPFFLMLLAERFNQEKSLHLNRAELYEMFLLNRIELDQNHFKTTFDLRSKRQEILLLLQKVALSMEILSKNYIKESEILGIISSNDFNALKYCTAFKKKDGEESIWQFEHNNIQEFLAAKALSNLQFEKVIQFIAFVPKRDKLIPSWANTLSFLFSILNNRSNLFNDLLEWLLANEKEVIVKFEPDKIADDVRVRIFQGIFDYYKTHDVWINSNKFSNRELARFGQSELNVRFLIDEIIRKENTRTVCLNAINLVGHFQIEKDELRDEIERILLEQINLNIKDPNFIHSVIYALKWGRFTSANIVSKLMETVGSQKNQYVRAAMYAILLKSDSLENSVGYLMEGFELIDKTLIGERDDVSLIDEEWNLKECIKSIKSPNGIKKVAEFISESTRFEYGFDSEKIVEAIVVNAVEAYKIDSSVLNTMLLWFINDIDGFRIERVNLILQFFDQTSTREEAFYKIWQSAEEDNERNKALVIAKLLTPDLMQFIIAEYFGHNLSKKDIEGIYYDMGWVNNEHRDQFEELVNIKTDFRLKKPEQIDHKALREKNLKHDFYLLFDQYAFKEAIIGVFEREKKEILTIDDLFEIRRGKKRLVDVEDLYPSVALGLLRDLARQDQYISKKVVSEWFSGVANEEWYRVSHIYNLLTNNKGLTINSSQKQWITQWCIDNVPKVEFKKAILVYDDGRITFNSMAMYIWYFSRRFDLDHPKSVLLDMLSFDFFEDRDGIEYLATKLAYDDIVDRMLENIEEGIADDSVLKNHIIYLCQNKIKESYPFILNEIVNFKRSDYRRREFLDIFFEHTKDLESLKTIIDQSDSTLRFAILDKLKTNNQEIFVEKYLLNILEKVQDADERGKIAEILVSLQNMIGLKAYVDWIRENVDEFIDVSRSICLNSLKSPEAIPFLIDLLEISYLRGIKVDQYERFNSQVLGAFYNIALVSEDNFEQVKYSLQEFMVEKLLVHDDVKYILHTIQRMEEQFYMNYAQSFSIKQVKEKLELLD